VKITHVALKARQMAGRPREPGDRLDLSKVPAHRLSALERARVVRPATEAEIAIAAKEK